MQPITSPEIDKDLSYIYGDPWIGLGACSVIVEETGAPPTPPLDRVSLEFINMFTVALPVTNAANWEFTDPQAVYSILIPGTYEWLIRLTDAADVPQTFMKGTLIVTDK